MQSKNIRIHILNFGFFRSNVLPPFRFFLRRWVADDNTPFTYRKIFADFVSLFSAFLHFSHKTLCRITIPPIPKVGHRWFYSLPTIKFAESGKRCWKVPLTYRKKISNFLGGLNQKNLYSAFCTKRACYICALLQMKNSFYTTHQFSSRAL